MSTELIPTQPQALARTAPIASFDIESIFRLAIEKEGTAETLEKLMGIRREINAELSKKAFDEAMAAFQAECPQVDKPKNVPDSSGKTAYAYAPFDYIVSVVKPCRLQHGFSYTLDTDTESKDGWVIAKCVVTHCAGHARTSTAKFPLGAGTRMMSTTQIFAAALSFACRRVFCNAFGIVPVGEDLDGQTSRPKPAGPSTLAAEPTVKELATELWALLKPTVSKDADWDPKSWMSFNRWLWREEILDGALPESAPNLPAKRFREVIDAARKKL